MSTVVVRKKGSVHARQQATVLINEPDPDSPSEEYVFLLGGSNFQQPIEPYQPEHDFPADWNGMFGRIYDAAVEKSAGCDS